MLPAEAATPRVHATPAALQAARHALAGTPGPATPGGAGGGAGAGGKAHTPVRALIETQERELAGIGEARARALGRLALERESELAALTQRFKALRGDFQYNLRLLEDRDAELERLEGAEAKHQRELDELRAAGLEAERQRAAAEARAQEAAQRGLALERRAADAEAALEAGQRLQQEELRRAQADGETRLQAQLQEAQAAQAAADHAQRDIATTYDTLLRDREAEYLRRHQDLAARLQAAEGAQREAARAAEDARAKTRQVQERLAGMALRAEKAEASLQAARTELQDIKGARQIAAERFEEERQTLERTQERVMQEYERKCLEMVSSLRAVEEAFDEERAEATADLEREQAVTRGVQEQLTEAQARPEKIEAAEAAFREETVREGEMEKVKYETQLEAAQDQMAALKEQVAGLEAEKAEAAEAADALHATEARLTRELKEQGINLEKERNLMAELKKEIDSLQQVIAGLHEQVKLAVPLVKLSEAYSKAAAASEAVSGGEGPDFSGLKGAIRSSLKLIQKLSGGSLENFNPLEEEALQLILAETQRLKGGGADAFSVFNDENGNQDRTQLAAKYKALKGKLKDANTEIVRLKKENVMPGESLPRTIPTHRATERVARAVQVPRRAAPSPAMRSAAAAAAAAEEEEEMRSHKVSKLVREREKLVAVSENLASKLRQETYAGADAARLEGLSAAGKSSLNAIEDSMRSAIAAVRGAPVPADAASHRENIEPAGGSEGERDAADLGRVGHVRSTISAARQKLNVSAVGEINVPPARLKTAIGTAAAKRSKAKTKEAERSIRERREELRAKRGLVRTAFDDEAAR